MDIAAQRAWMEQWRNAATALEEQRRHELRSLSDRDALAASQHGRLDERLIWSELTPLLELKEAPEAAQRLRALLDRAE